MAEKKPTAKKAALPFKSEKAGGDRKETCGPPAKRRAGKGEGDETTPKPALRERLKKRDFRPSDKGGRAGTMERAQGRSLLAVEYEKTRRRLQKRSARTSQQKHLESWTEEKWQTTDGKKGSAGARTTARYLPAQSLGPTDASATQSHRRKEKKPLPAPDSNSSANTPVRQNARAKPP